MFILNLKNNFNNTDFFKRYVRGARLSRGKNIPNKNIINFKVDKDPKIKVIADIQGSGNSRYVVNIKQDNYGYRIVHDCPDFRNGFKFCKHIVKIMLLLEPDVCQAICQDYRRIDFSTNFDLIKESKTESHILKAEDLINQSKNYEAINFLQQAFKESKSFDYILKIGEIALKYQLYDLFLDYSVKFKELINKYSESYPEAISTIISNLNNNNFSKNVEDLINIQRLLAGFNNDLLIRTLNQSQIHNISDPILKYIILHNLDSKIYLHDHFRDLIKDQKSNLKELISKLTLEAVNEAILNMESEEVIESFRKIVAESKFDNSNIINSKIQNYKNKLREVYREGLKSKHAFLRSLVISNTNSDKLRQMKFTKRYNYPSLIWASPYKSEPPLHYYILEKCGFERHHLEYTELDNFIENYPVFAEIFGATNPVRHDVKNFWDTFEPKIMNIVHHDPNVELEFEVNLHELKNFVLIEWDLAQKPILGSYICQFSDGYLIPDKSHPLTHYIQPFDLVLCEKKPIAIKMNNIKIMKPLRRINIKSSIELVWSGIDYVVSYLPLDIINDLKNFKLDELDAIEKVYEKYHKSFLPNKDKSQKDFIDFIQDRITKELNQIYLKIIDKSNYKNKVLKMIGFDRYSTIFTKRTELLDFKHGNLKKGSLNEVKFDLKKSVSQKLIELIKQKDFKGINLRILKGFPTFKKITLKLIYELKKQLETCGVFQVGEKLYDIKNLIENHYGEIIINKTLQINSNMNKSKSIVSDIELQKIFENFKFLKIKLPKIIKKTR
ncbi:MAG: hypothetical protein ACFE9Z_12630 [Promethearchaeota archaeon]